MKTAYFTLFRCLVLVSIVAIVFNACKGKQNEPESIVGNAARPTWTASADYNLTASMTAVIKVDLSVTYPEQVQTLNKTIVNENDILAAFDGDKCVGVAQFTDGLFYLFITEGEYIRLRYYSSLLKNTFVCLETITFRNDEQLGTVSEPFIPNFVMESSVR